MITVAISNVRPVSASFLRDTVISMVVRIIPVIVRGAKE
jgi:hypothetical protein